MLRSYRLQILAPSPSAEMQVIEEHELRVQDTGAAIEGMLRTPWPPKATFARIVDLNGVVILIGWSSLSGQESDPERSPRRQRAAAHSYRESVPPRPSPTRRPRRRRSPTR